ncbi:L-fuconolactonase [Paenibacillus sp. UNCCL117]|uniref:amidohydrolase family protein n=1 Tax=unclassified Paenibacillus TaxID=185978 RepID=UPI00087EB7CB|nr:MULTISPECIES: amidohydrolase family protein [unclassified Paenibacillus]SDD96614.1 L-fuconolactonase [Paenibacillus sp. cl123]SFW56349.1 L-fuconolactonase [Paenibacillus sp. UNCCL117]
MYVDSHVHFWKLSRGDYGWLKEDNARLYQDYMPERLLPELHACGVKELIAVQAAPTAEEAAFLLELSQIWPLIAGVSGGLDPFADRFSEQLESLAASPRLAGIRLNGSAFRADRPAAEQRRLRAALVGLLEADLTLDLLAQPGDLAGAAVYLEEVPALRAVINHLGCPNVREGKEEPWHSGMERLARLPHTAVKLSGMITMAGGPRAGLLRPYVERLVRMFGSDRLMFGSDWPVALQAGGYGDVIRLFEEVLPAELEEEAKGKIRAGNARRYYGLHETS